MPYTQSFDQLFTTFVLVAAAVYLLRAVLGVLLLLVGVFPSRLGIAARRAGAKVTPRLVMRAISTLTGVLVAATGIGAQAALAAPAPSATSSSSATKSQLATDALVAIDRGPTKGRPTTIKKKPTAQQSAHTPASGKSTTGKSDNASSKSSAKSTRPLEKTKGQRASVTVKPGDTLWAIAHRHLGDKASDRQIDREWRRWHQTNKDVIGSNPNLIIPGTKLEAPTA